MAAKRRRKGKETIFLEIWKTFATTERLDFFASEFKIDQKFLDLRLHRDCFLLNSPPVRKLNYGCGAYSQVQPFFEGFSPIPL